MALLGSATARSTGQVSKGTMRVPHPQEMHSRSVWEKIRACLSRCAYCRSDKSGEFIGCARCKLLIHKGCVEVPDILLYPPHPDHSVVILDVKAEEGEEDEEIKQRFRMGLRKKKKSERSPAEIALLVEEIIAELELAADLDADANRKGNPAINKLRKLPLLTDVLSKRQLQQEFLDHGVLSLLKSGLELLPDKNLPNINIRPAILQILFSSLNLLLYLLDIIFFMT